jgi:hypothetical protein
MVSTGLIPVGFIEKTALVIDQRCFFGVNGDSLVRVYTNQPDKSLQLITVVSRFNKFF